MPQSNLSATLNNKRALGDKIIEKHIKPFFPELNIAWLLTGKGEMLNNEKAFIDWGRVYVLDTCNGAVIKKIMSGSTEGRIKCLSINEEYPSFEVAFGDIFGMYRVLMCMSLK